MKIFYIIIYILLAVCASVTITDAGTKPYIARYLHDKPAAFSITCDDGFSHQVKNTLEIFDPLDIKATFFIMPFAIEEDDTGQFVSWEQVKEMQAAGHEIGTHARIENRLHLVGADTLDRIINGGYRLIAEKTGIAPVSYANPGGSKLTGAVRKKVLEKHFFIRSSKILPDILQGGYGSVPGKREWADDKARKQILQAIREHKWRVAAMHSIVNGWSPFNSKEEALTHFAWVAQQEDLWIAPMGTVGRYVYARNAAELTVHDQQNCSIAFSVSCDLEPRDVFNLPLTVVIPVSAKKATAVSADGTVLPVSLVPGKILIEVPADGQWVKVMFDN